MAIKKDIKRSRLIKCNSPITREMRGKKYGHLSVIKCVGGLRLPSGVIKPYVEAVCECGSIHLYDAQHLRSGHSVSCGCFQAKNTSNIHTTHGQKSPKYGKRGTILYARWRSIFDRVRSNRNYKNVIISERWKGVNGFVNFCNDMGEMPTPKHTVDRYPISNGNYEPSNCRWATMIEQGNNTIRNVHITYNQEKLTLAQAVRKYGLSRTEVSKISAIQNNKVYANQKIK